MKAWYLTTVEQEEAVIVFAENVSKAKQQINSTDIWYDRYIDVRATRARRYDNLEKLPDSQLALM